MRRQPDRGGRTRKKGRHECRFHESIDHIEGATATDMPMSKVFMTLAIASLASAQTVDQLTPHKVKVEQVEYKGKRAIKIVGDGDAPKW